MRVTPVDELAPSAACSFGELGPAAPTAACSFWELGPLAPTAACAFGELGPVSPTPAYSSEELGAVAPTAAFDFCLRFGDSFFAFNVVFPLFLFLCIFFGSVSSFVFLFFIFFFYVSFPFFHMRFLRRGRRS